MVLVPGCGIHCDLLTHAVCASLYHSLHDVYAPMFLTSKEKTGDKASVKGRLQELMLQLEAGLGSAMRTTEKVVSASSVAVWGRKPSWPCF
jgi:hypothetical protein